MIKRVIATIVLISLVLISARPGIEAEAAQKKVSVGTFLKMIESRTGKAAPDTGMKTNKKLTVEKAALILVKAYEGLYGESAEEFPDEETIRFIMDNRIIFEEAASDKREYLAKAYALGLIAGESKGKYSPYRVISGKAKCSKTECSKMVNRLVDPGKRFKLSPDYQVLRISNKKRPVLERFYSYILDSYPNEYYDCMFNFMIHQAKVFEADESPLWEERNCTSYHDVMTWDTVFSKLNYEDRIDYLCNYDQVDRLKLYCAYLTPAEYDRGAMDRYERTGNEGMALTNERKRSMADAAEEYVMRVMNVDYRTIADDKEWQEYMMRCGVEKTTIDNYIAECIKDELILECDMTAADISGIYYDRTPFAFTGCKGVVHTYAHYRVVSDNGKGFPFDELTIVNGSGRQCLRNGVIGEDGYRYVSVPDNDWQDGYFDIGMANDKKVYTSIFDIMRYKAVFIADFGYPCESPYYYPGCYTIDGVIKYKMKNRTKEEYLERWGYLYSR